VGRRLGRFNQQHRALDSRYRSSAVGPVGQIKAILRARNIVQDDFAGLASPTKGVRHNTNFAFDINARLAVQSLPQKYSTFVFPEFMLHSPIPPRHEGRIAIVTRREVGSDGRGCAAARLGRADERQLADVKSQRPGTPMLVSRRW